MCFLLLFRVFKGLKKRMSLRRSSKKENAPTEKELNIPKADDTEEAVSKLQGVSYGISS